MLLIQLPYNLHANHQRFRLCSYRSMVSKSLQQCQLVIKNCLDMSGSSKVPTNSWAQVTKFVAELLPAEIDDRSVTLLAACLPLKFMLMLHVF